eukprot:7376979-Prymnesium_polylepis.1
MDLFKDPVKTELNFTYERSAIEEWFALGNKSDPLTGVSLPSLILTDDFVMLAKCRYFSGQGRGGRGGGRGGRGRGGHGKCDGGG